MPSPCKHFGNHFCGSDPLLVLARFNAKSQLDFYRLVTSVEMTTFPACKCDSKACHLRYRHAVYMDRFWAFL